MSYVDEILYEFEGQLRIQDIYGMTYKELGYLRKHRRDMKAARGPTIKPNILWGEATKWKDV